MNDNPFLNKLSGEPKGNDKIFIGMCKESNKIFNAKPKDSIIRDGFINKLQGKWT